MIVASCSSGVAALSEALAHISSFETTYFVSKTSLYFSIMPESRHAVVL